MRIDNISKIIIQKPRPTQLTRGERRISDHINKNIEGKNTVLLAKPILEKINNIVVLNNSTDKTFNDYLSRLGKSVTDTVFRKIFITEFAGKNTFYLSLYERALKSDGAETLLKAFDFKKLIGNKKDCSVDYYTTALKNKFYSMIAIIYSSASIETAEKVLKPLLMKTLKMCDDSFITKFFKHYSKTADKKLNINISEAPNNVFTATTEFDNKHLSETSEISPENAIIALYRKIMAKKNLFPFQNYVEHNKKTSPSDEIINIAENILIKTGFKSANESINTRVHMPHEYIINALSPEKYLELMSINHQKFEFYGDAICNMLTERFLLEKKLDRKYRHIFYKEMTSNQTFQDYFNKIGLNKLIKLDNIKSDKEKADLFEAFVGALHFCYPEKKVYEFLKQIFNQKYSEILTDMR